MSFRHTTVELDADEWMALRQRGDTYRARALALLRSTSRLRYWKRYWAEQAVIMAGKLGGEAGLKTACDLLNSKLAAAESDSRKLRELLARAQKELERPMEYRSGHSPRKARIPLDAEIDAALAAAAGGSETK